MNSFPLNNAQFKILNKQITHSKKSQSIIKTDNSINDELKIKFLKKLNSGNFRKKEGMDFPLNKQRSMRNKAQKSIDDLNSKVISYNKFLSSNFQKNKSKKIIKSQQDNKNNNKNYKNNLNFNSYKNNKPFLSVSNISFFPLSNIHYFDNPKNSLENIQESKDFNSLFNNNNKGKHFNNYNNKQTLTTFVKMDDLTPLPDRIGEKKHYLAEYDYNEAKRAAITCRRIEYSYNLRTIVKSEICLDEIVFIQRWWRDILYRKAKGITKDSNIERNKINQNLENYQKALDKLNYIYLMNSAKRFISKMKIKYAKAYYKNKLNNSASKIQKAFKLYEKNKDMEKFNLFTNALYKTNKKLFFKNLAEFVYKIKKLMKLQNYIKYHFLNRKESHYLEMSNQVHPYMYYYLKYGKIKKNDEEIIKNKIKGFQKVFKKLKNYLDKKKISKALIHMNQMHLLVKKKYFSFFILRVLDRINNLMTLFFLTPLMKTITNKIYVNEIKVYFVIWKAKIKTIKKRNILSMKNFEILINKYILKTFCRKVKKIYQN